VDSVTPKGQTGGWGEERTRLIEEQVARLIEAGASVAWREKDVRGSSVVMRDPEGNEFCVA
jgi:Glyoxalase-like domain